MKHIEKAAIKRLEKAAEGDDVVRKVKQTLSKELKISVWKELGDYEIGYASTDLFAKRATLEQKIRDALYAAVPDLDWNSEVYKKDNKHIGMIHISGSIDPDESDIEMPSVSVCVNVVSNLVSIESD